MMRFGNASSITGDSRRMKPAQSDQLDLVSAQRGDHGAVEILARREPAMVDDHRLDSVTARALESLRVGAIRDHDADFGFEFAAHDRVDDRLQIGAVAGNQDAEFDRRICRHRIEPSDSLAQRIDTPRAPRATSPMM